MYAISLYCLEEFLSSSSVPYFLQIRRQSNSFYYNYVIQKSFCGGIFIGIFKEDFVNSESLHRFLQFAFSFNKASYRKSKQRRSNSSLLYIFQNEDLSTFLYKFFLDLSILDLLFHCHS